MALSVGFGAPGFSLLAAGCPAPPLKSTALLSGSTQTFSFVVSHSSTPELPAVIGILVSNPLVIPFV